MKRLELVTSLTFLLLSGNAIAADVAGKHSIRGAGLIDCATFLEEQKKKSRTYLMMGGWVDGYITGINQHATGTYDATSFESTELFLEIVRIHCEKNSADRLFPIMNSIIAQRWQNRITIESPLVGIRLGEQGVQIYRETIIRIQRQLAAKGHYEGDPSGSFDAATITAIAAYQETIEGYEATGFPDQATLLALMAE